MMVNGAKDALQCGEENGIEVKFLKKRPSERGQENPNPNIKSSFKIVEK
jgi:hypothetical protein